MIRGQKGQSLVEFALVIPLFLLLTLGIIDLGRMTYSYLQMTFITQEAVRKAGLHSPDAEVIQYAKDRLHLGDPADLLVTVAPDPALRKRGEYVTVTLSYPSQRLSLFIDVVIPADFRMETSAAIRIE